MDTFMLYGALTILAIGIIGSIGMQIAIIRLEYREWRKRKANKLVKDYFTQLETQGGKS